MALSSSPKSIIVKAGNQFNGYVSNFTHNQKIQNKNKLAFVFKEIYFIFKVKEFSSYFLFKMRARLKLLHCISKKIVPYCWTLYRYSEVTFAKSSYSFAIIYAGETCWIQVRRHLKGCMKSCRACSRFYFMHEDGSI